MKYEQNKEHWKILCKTFKLAKKSYYGRKFDNFKTDPKKIWSLINDLRGKSKTPPKSSCRLVMHKLQAYYLYYNLKSVHD